MVAAKNQMIDDAATTIYQLTADERIRQQCEAREDYLRRSGTAAWDMCCVALGRCSLYFELKIQRWDYAAAALIAEEAGCTVTDIHGTPLSYRGATSVLCRARGVKEIPECFA